MSACVCVCMCVCEAPENSARGGEDEQLESCWRERVRSRGHVVGRSRERGGRKEAGEIRADGGGTRNALCVTCVSSVFVLCLALGVREGGGVGIKNGCVPYVLVPVPMLAMRRLLKLLPLGLWCVVVAIRSATESDRIRGPNTESAEKCQKTFF